MSKLEDNKTIVGRWFTDFWGATCNLAIVDELAAPDMLLQYSLHAPRRGHDDIKAFMAGFREAFPDLSFSGADFVQPVAASRTARRTSDNRRIVEMKTIVITAILLAALGSGVAMAQGLPPGYGAWQSGWRGGAEAPQAQAMRAPQRAKTRPEGRVAVARNSGSVSLAGTQGAPRGS
jgi:SnoaL-like polyketide cyclase